MDAVFGRLSRTFDSSSSSKSGRCSHVQRLNMKDFKRRCADKFAISHTQSGLELQCETCGGKRNLWICLNCCKVLCIGEGEHALAHRNGRRGCDLLLSCEDSHILCCACEKYLYPREIAGNSEHERILTPAVEAWLQVLGRSRNWWREMEYGAFAGCHGLRNFGNTCFFTSTMQALLHSRPLRSGLRQGPAKGQMGEIQKAFLMLQKQYWDDHEDEATLDPRGLWDAVVSHAVFGEYSENNMEDANTLLLDVLDALDEATVHATFGVQVSSQTTCSVCSRHRRSCCNLLSRWFPQLPPRAWESIAESVIGAPYTTTATEVVLALPLVNEASAAVERFAGERRRLGGESSGSSSLADQSRIGMVGAGEGEVTLAELLGAYLAPEWITDFTCEHCKTLGKVLKRFSLRSTQDALVFNLKRFAATASGARIKVHRKVSIPLVLDLSALLGSAAFGSYELVSMVVHDGGMGGGHYMAYARHRRGRHLTSEWLWFSDQHFGPVSSEEVFNSEPFLLFYERAQRKVL